MSNIYIRGDAHVCPNPLSSDSFSICEMGCKYCFIRSSYQTFMKQTFERGLLPTDLKELNKVLKSAFSNKESNNPVVLSLRAGLPVIVGRKCEPFCPSEMKYHNTQGMINLFSDYGVKTFVEFKGTGLDIDAWMSKATGALVSIMPAKPHFHDLLEPGTLNYEERFKLAKKLKEIGLWVGLTAEPILPTISDEEGVFEEYSLRAKEANADHVNFGEFRTNNPKYVQHELSKVNISLRKILQGMKDWKAIGTRFMFCVKSQGIKCSTPDWVNFGFANDKIGCCGISGFGYHRFNFQYALEILKEKDRVYFRDLAKYNIFGPEYEENFRKIWNNPKRYFSLKDVDGISSLGIDSNGDWFYGRRGNDMPNLKRFIDKYVEEEYEK